MYPHRCGVVPFKASIRSGKCFCCCWSADMPAQRLALITTIMAEVLMVKELTGSTTLTEWRCVAHAAQHGRTLQRGNEFASTAAGLAAGGCRTLPMDRQMMAAKWLCLVVSRIAVRGLGV